MDLLQSREIDTVLDSVYKVNIVSLPVLTQLLSSESAEPGCTRAKKNDPNMRGFTLTFPSPSEKSVLHCGYRYSAAFSTMEFSSPTGPVGVFNRDGLGLGLLGFLCPFLCLCCCFPVATASIKDARTGDQLLKGGAYLLPRKIDMSRPSNLGGRKIGVIHLGGILMNQTITLSFEQFANPSEKLLLIGLGAGMMDYEQFHLAHQQSSRY
ncbi:uncharacterized protein LOC110844746 isoform X2 [Folsomia candida]|uniref:uncharacterized protein LOC110844746 isoform X2 n=1 Tax=Folsomia candida TaxID=158441 RepID=UPI0016051B49|nr:uncharacterized protein LOC110844746 isoform X2 [Folsomia candida]